ncbi:hypothetical protein LRS09_15270 [Mesorhizobium sp. J428]|nr:hypothetical protein [Mesorhizobium sp. J428]MCR5858042.1 hypothetical protein [Mesorhizobium sp. J428]
MHFLDAHVLDDQVEAEAVASDGIQELRGRARIDIGVDVAAQLHLPNEPLELAREDRLRLDIGGAPFVLRLERGGRDHAPNVLLPIIEAVLQIDANELAYDVNRIAFRIFDDAVEGLVHHLLADLKKPEKNVALRSEIIVDRGRRYFGEARDILHGRFREALRGEEIGGGKNNRPVSTQPLPVAQSQVFANLFHVVSQTSSPATQRSQTESAQAST